MSYFQLCRDCGAIMPALGQCTACIIADLRTRLAAATERIKTLEGLLREARGNIREGFQEAWSGVEIEAYIKATSDLMASIAAALSHPAPEPTKSAITATDGPVPTYPCCGAYRDDPHEDDCPKIFGEPAKSEPCAKCGGSGEVMEHLRFEEHGGSILRATPCPDCQGGDS